MKRNLYISVLTLTLVLAVTAVSGAAVINDLVTIPTADLLAAKGSVTGEVLDDVTRVEAVFNLEPRIEFGGQVLQYRDDETDAGVLAKVAFAPEKGNQPAIAGGVKGEDLYLVLSKGLGYGLRGHMGIGNGQFDGLFVGINKVINPVTVEISEGNDTTEAKISNNNFPPISLMAEYVNEEINLGVKVNMDNNLYLDLGVLDLEELKAGLSYAF